MIHKPRISLRALSYCLTSVISHARAAPAQLCKQWWASKCCLVLKKTDRGCLWEVLPWPSFSKLCNRPCTTDAGSTQQKLTTKKVGHPNWLLNRASLLHKGTAAVVPKIWTKECHLCCSALCTAQGSVSNKVPLIFKAWVLSLRPSCNGFPKGKLALGCPHLQRLFSGSAMWASGGF